MKRENSKNTAAIVFATLILGFAILSVGAFIVAKNHAQTMLDSLPAQAPAENVHHTDTATDGSTSSSEDLTATETQDRLEPLHGEEYATSPLPQWSPVYGFCERIIEIARNEPKEAEDASGVTKYGTHFNDPAGEWCTEFALWCVIQTQAEYGVEYTNRYYPYASWAGGCVQWYKKQGCYFSKNNYVPRMGDMMFFDYNADGTADHTGLVTGVEFDETEQKLYILTIEGNLPEDYPVGSIKERRLAADWKTILGYGTFVYEPSMNTLAKIEE